MDRLMTPSPAMQIGTTIETLAPSGLSHPAVKSGLEAWLQLRGDRTRPSCEEVTPRAFRRSLRDLCLVKLIDRGADLEFRIVGDGVCRRFQMRLQNRRITDLSRQHPDEARWIYALCRRVLELQAPLGLRICVGEDLPALRFSCAEMLLLPLGSREGGIDHLISVFGFASDADRTGFGSWSAAR